MKITCIHCGKTEAEHCVFEANMNEAIVRDCAEIAGNSICDTHLPTGVKIFGQVAKKNILDRYGLK